MSNENNDGGNQWADFSAFGNDVAMGLGWDAQFGSSSSPSPPPPSSKNNKTKNNNTNAATIKETSPKRRNERNSQHPIIAQMVDYSNRRPRASQAAATSPSSFSPKNNGTLQRMQQHQYSSSPIAPIAAPPTIKSPRNNNNSFKKSPKSSKSTKSTSTMNGGIHFQPSSSSERPSISVGLPPISFDGPLFDPPTPSSSSSPTTTTTTSTIIKPLTSIRRTNWNVRDVSLPPVPPLCPPLNSKNVVCISDASPSVVATRISDCLYKRSVGVEYDDEAAAAYGMTSDNVHFTINLYRGGKTGTLFSNSPPIIPLPPPEGKKEKIKPDFSSIVIVECTRIRGDVCTYHHCRTAILSSASGNSDGLDDFRGDFDDDPKKTNVRGLIHHSPFSFRGRQMLLLTSTTTTSIATRLSKKKLLKIRDENNDDEATELPNAVLTAKSLKACIQSLQRVLNLLSQKDRLDSQLLGMESLVMLTDGRSSGVSTATNSALIVLGSSYCWDDEKEESVEIKGQRNQLAVEIHKWIVSLVRDGHVPGSGRNGGGKRGAGSEIFDSSDEFSSAYTKTGANDEEVTLRMAERLTGGEESVRGSNNSFRTRRRPPGIGDVQHFGSMRRLALRVLSNALVIASCKKRDGVGNMLSFVLENFSQDYNNNSNSNNKKNNHNSRWEKMKKKSQQHACITREFLSALAEDLAGASRPPSASLWEGAARCVGTTHEAALAAKCLRLIVTYSGKVRDIIVNEMAEGGSNIPLLLTSVRRAREVGKANHLVLEKEVDMLCLALRQCCGIKNI